MKLSALFSLRGLGLLATIATLVVLSLGSTGWAQVAVAQTVPTLTSVPPPTSAASPRPTAILPSATPIAPADTSTAPPPATATAPAQTTATQIPANGAPDTSTTGVPTAAVSADLKACGPGPYALATQVSIAPSQLALSVGGVTLLALDGLDTQSGAPLIVSRLGAEVIPTDQLPAVPAGWRLIACGLQSTSSSASGQTAAFLSGGLIACQAVPADARASPFVRLAYFDSRPGIGRWVFIPSQETAGEVCSSRFRLPAVFALLSGTP